MNFIAAVFLIALQQDQTIFRTEKGDYTGPINRCKEAEELITTDPAGAVSRLDEIIANPKLRKIECRVRIEERPSEYSLWYLFLPHQFRGRARMNLAKKADNENAQKLVAGAIQDFQASVDRKVSSSEDLLKAASAELAKLKAAAAVKPTDPAKEDPVLKFREAWQPLLRENRYKSARALIDAEGKGLPEEQKNAFIQNTETQCKEYLVTQVSQIRPRVLSALAQGVDRLTSEEFDVNFALPPAAELVVSHPAIDWLRKHLPMFRDLQAGKATVQSIENAAVESAPLEDKFENPWFRALEGLVYQNLKANITAEVEKTRTAAKADRDKSRAQVQALLAQWKAFSGKLDPKFLERHRFVGDHEGQLSRLLDGFPVELPELAKSEVDLDAVFSADAPDKELARIERELDGFDSRANITRESRQRLYTVRITAAALRGLLAGKTEDILISELGTYGQKLRDVGGPADASKYGPRVAKVFGGLR